MSSSAIHLFAAQAALRALAIAGLILSSGACRRSMRARCCLS